MRLFAVDIDALQLTWRDLAPGDHVVAAGPAAATVNGRVGSVELSGLAPSTRYEVLLDGVPIAKARTLDHPGGTERSRLATISDLHIGERGFGFAPRLRLEGDELHGTICTRAALADLMAWGADRLVIKGDLAHDNQPGEYDELAAMLTGVSIPIDLIAGNHDGGNHRGPGRVESLVRPGVTFVDSAARREVAGVNLVLGSTFRAGHGYAATDHVEAMAACLAGGGPSLLLLHHQFSPVPWHLPPGFMFRNAWRTLERIHAANPNVVISSGHTHRHRRKTWRSLILTEVGSPKDYPGTWAGYRFFDGGMVQVVRRVSDPAAMAWNDCTARAVFGAWGHWSPGRLADRCFTHRWPQGN
jgi:predicted phosphodiesterase